MAVFIETKYNPGYTLFQTLYTGHIRSPFETVETLPWEFHIVDTLRGIQRPKRAFWQKRGLSSTSHVCKAVQQLCRGFKTQTRIGDALAVDEGRRGHVLASTLEMTLHH